MKTLYLECNMGASDTMLMSSLFEICEQKDFFLDTMNAAFEPYHLIFSAGVVERHGVHGATLLLSETEEFENPCLSDYPSILKEVLTLSLSEDVKNDIAAIYKLIGDANASLLLTSIEKLHFQKLGTIHTIAEIAGCVLLFHILNADRVICSPIHVGCGFTQDASGVVPVPSPLTAELLREIPFYTGSITGELLTPVYAAILKYFVDQFSTMPVLSVSQIGYGFGAKDYEIPNCVRSFIGEEFVAPTVDLTKNADDTASGEQNEPSADASDTSCEDKVLGISCNLDDMTGESIGLATEILLKAGALDVYVIPIQMKKNRPGILLNCLCNLSERERFTGLIFLHTTTRGVRYQTYERAKLESSFESRTSPYGDIRIKKSSGYGVKKEKPEFEDLKSIVLESGYSIMDISDSIRPGKSDEKNN